MLTKQLQHIILLFTLAIAFLFFFSSFSFRSKVLSLFELTNSHNLTLDSNLFISGNVCEGCHGFDLDGLASVDESGNDVNVFDDWKTSMMGMSAIDPFWRAKVRHEGILYPSAKEIIEDKCTTCHAPMGKFSEILGGAPYSLDAAISDSLGLDGVSCLVCHMQRPEGIGHHFSGGLSFDLDKKVYGPYPDPFDGPMKEFVGYTPVFGEYIQSSEGCAACHTLITEALNPDGTFSGQHFVEQATYHEWLNSKYAVTGVTCLTCHLPQIEDEVVIASNYSFLEGRAPFGIHTFNGANAFMLKMIRDNNEILGVEVADSLFDKSIENTMDLLQKESVEMDIIDISNRDDSVFVEIKLTNITGHKFPSGYPSRRAFVSVLATNSDGDTLFHSGKWNSEFQITSGNPTFQHHHDIITHDSMTQIYELVPGDVDGISTSAMLAAVSPIKDNRLPPIGFTRDHPVYDTTLIAGLALEDTDFNIDSLNEGSGSDIITYGIKLNEPIESLNLNISFWYQSIAPQWLDNLFLHAGDSIISGFNNLYQISDNTPLLVSSVSDTFYLTDVKQEVEAERTIRIYPNPVKKGMDVFFQKESEIDRITVSNIHGKVVENIKNNSQTKFEAPKESGIYFLILSYQGISHTMKLIVL